MSTKTTKKRQPKRTADWISVSEAAIILHVRYLKARDLASTGVLGEVERTDSGRYFVRRDRVESYRDQQQEKEGRRRAS